MNEMQRLIDICNEQNILFSTFKSGVETKIVLDEDLIGKLRTKDNLDGNVFESDTGRFIRYGN